MKIKIGINGFGRIGRAVLKNILKGHPQLEVVAINDLTEPETLLHLYRYDSVYGKSEAELGEKTLQVEGNSIILLSEKDPENLPWEKMGVEIVLECTGLFSEYEKAKKHLNAGAKRVIISAPSKDPEKIPSLVLGVNEEKFNPEEDEIVDMGSCTTNCLAPIVKVLHEKFGFQSGMMTTVHSYTSSQNLVDAPHKDLRRARAAAVNFLPTTTGAAKAIGRVLPELDGKIDGIAIRVPTPTVSMVDLTCKLEKEIKREEVNDAFREYSTLNKKVLHVEDEPLVSSDYIGSNFSSVVDAEMTEVKGDLVKVISWYDNEWAYAKKLAEFTEYIAQK